MPDVIQTVKSEPVALAKPVADALRPKVAPLDEAKVKTPRPRMNDIERGDLPSAKPTATAVPLPVVKRKTTVPSPPHTKTCRYPDNPCSRASRPESPHAGRNSRR